MNIQNVKNDGRSLQSRLVFWFVLIILSLGIFIGYLAGVWWDEPRLALDELINGTAAKPYVYRVLVPLLVKAAVIVGPNEPRIYAAIVMYLSLLGSVLSLRYLAQTFWLPSPATDVWSLFSLIALLPLMLTNRHIWDFSTLFLFTLGLALLMDGRLTAFMLLYPIACLNKETTILLSVVFAVCWYRRIEHGKFLGLLIIQVMIYGAIRLALVWIFRDNPGSMLEYHWEEHLRFVLNAPVLVLIYALFGLGVLVLMLSGINGKPQMLRQAASVVIPPMFILYLLFGGPLELRVFYEAFPIAYALAIPTLGNLTGLSVEPVSSASYAP